MLTEDEAKKRWCPFARLIAPNGAEIGQPGPVLGLPAGYNKVVNPRGQSMPAAACIGSACMAWRWAGEFEDARTKATAPAGAYPPGVLDERGYCGLAGKP